MSEKVERILKKYPSGRQEYLLCAMQDIQDEFGYIPDEGIVLLSSYMGIPTASVYGTASFYNTFRFSGRGLHHFCVCRGSACHLGGGAGTLSFLEKALNIKDGSTSSCGKFSLEAVECLGSCHQSPVISVNDKIYPAVTPDVIHEIIKKINDE